MQFICLLQIKSLLCKVLEKMDKEKIINLKGSSIPYRINSSYCQLTSNGKPYLFVFGGYDDINDIFDDRIYILDIEDQIWLSSRSSGIYRNGCACVPLDEKGNILIIGGLLPEEEYRECFERNEIAKSVFQDCFVLIYNINRDEFNKEWNYKFQENILNDSGFTESDWIQLNRLERHSILLSTSSNKIYISGGVISDLPYGMQKYMFVLDYLRFKIQKLSFCKKIEHEIMEFDNKIWSFGGLNETMKNSFMNIQIYDLLDGNVNEINFNINNNTYISQNSKKKTSTISFKKFFYNRISKNQILITDLLNSQFLVLNKDTFKTYQVPIQIENLYWLFVFSYKDNISIIGGKELNNDNNEVAYLNCMVSIPLLKFGKINGDAKMNNNLLLSKFQNAYRNGDFVDFKIKSNDNKEVNVHKLFLLFQWPYFENVIMSGMQESQTNEMVIDEPYTNIKMLIDYLYTKTFPNLSITELLSFAHLIELYDLSELKSIIINRIYSFKIPTNNLIEYWQLANLLNSAFLKNYIKSIIFNHWGIVVRLPSFKNLDKEQLLDLVTSLDLESQIVTGKQVSTSLLVQNGSDSRVETNQSHNTSIKIVTPEAQVNPSFDGTFCSPGVVDYWTPLEPNVSANDSSSSDSYMID